MAQESSLRVSRTIRNRIGPKQSATLHTYTDGSVVLILARPIRVDDIEENALKPIRRFCRKGKVITGLHLSADASRAIYELLDTQNDEDPAAAAARRAMINADARLARSRRRPTYTVPEN